MNELDELLKDLSASSNTRPISKFPESVPVKDLEELMNELQDGTSTIAVNPSQMNGLNIMAQRKRDISQNSFQNSPAPPKPISNQQLQQKEIRFTKGPISEKAHDDLQNILITIPTSERNSIMTNLNNGVESAEVLALCKGCNGPIYGTEMAITALGSTFHQEHFKCGGCKKGLAGETFFEKDGQAYCEKCMNEVFMLPSCAFCSEKIKGRCINALGNTWHPDHFFCSQCGKQFPPGAGFLEHEGKAYCEDDYYNMFAPKCATCDRAIIDEVVSALGKSFHAECFVCAEPGCKILLSETGSFFDFNGKAYCETHYHAARGSLCASCQKPITGRCITAIGKKFHPEHFVCAFCKKSLTSNGISSASGAAASFKEHDGKPYCVNCHVKLYA